MVPTSLRYIIPVLVGVCIFLNMIELISYLVLFRYLYNHDNQVAITILKPDVIKLRNSKNAISLVGQITTWLLESSYFILLMFYLRFNYNERTREIASICKLLEFTLIPIAQVSTSSPLRKYLIEKNLLLLLPFCVFLYVLIFLLLFQ